MTLKEKKETCASAFIAWVELEKHNKDMKVHNEEIEEIFTNKMILKKFKAFGIDIVLPDMLLMILAICTDCNPGQFQIILKDLLNNIKQRKGPIPAGYVITPMDFSLCFRIDFPITEIPHVNAKYEKLWNGQKKENPKDLESDNLCDTPEWWKEVME